MVKLQKQTRGNYMVAVNKQFLKALGWREDEELLLCPCNKNSLKLVPVSRE
ncbi:hypothetical protein RG963_06840 [Methanosarcina sp. Z-7115]|uniref:SpoVT-AbrB domain-containing protein n=1 Tax=Methanosarcina baikalica TaxID=3073890 RepID=A0ABU2D0K1_9EURY|nr:hypothetical protein [Methanosarcina sp. Z-7115]MDR7665499.1 hypothetical protein [Methanosarcina sp. Z-7115]